MKKIIISSFLLILLVSCNDQPLNKQEEKAVQTQVEKDQQAMDSLEKAIQAQINGTDTIK